MSDSTSALPGLASMPGRCGNCGFHIDTQRHRDGCPGDPPPPPPVASDLDRIAADVAVALRAVTHLTGRQQVHGYSSHPLGYMPPMPITRNADDDFLDQCAAMFENETLVVRLLLDGAPVTLFEWTDPPTPESLAHNASAESRWHAIKPPPPKRQRGNQNRDDPVLGATVYGIAGLEREIDELERTPEGARNDQLNRAAYNLGQLVGSDDLPEHLVVDVLWVSARAIGLTSSEVKATLRSGLEAGKANPRRR